MAASITSRLAILGLLGPMVALATPSVSLKFDFGPGPVAPSYTQVTAGMDYSPERGFGFEPGAVLTGIENTGSDPVRSDALTSTAPFYFSAALPAEGNYRVTVVLTRVDGKSPVTIKAELRRLMVDQFVPSASGDTCAFIVNTRTPKIVAAGAIKAGIVMLKAPRETVQEAWAWDKLLTLEFNGRAPAVCAVEIEPVEVPTLFLLGDSTVCDQMHEPYTSWGQMLPGFLKPEIAVANHAESGETYRDSIGRRRLDKIISVMKPGDWLFMQFGHNDQKQIAAGNGGPFTTYQAEMKVHIAAVKRAGGHAVVISSMERRGFDANGHIVPSLIDYAQAAREVAAEEQVPFIDLNAMSKKFYEALGPEKSALAFAAPEGKQDNTHHNNYGSYELARCIVQAIRDEKLELARFIRDDLVVFDPAKPDSFESFAVPPSPNFSNQRPLGD